MDERTATTDQFHSLRKAANYITRFQPDEDACLQVADHLRWASQEIERLRAWKAEATEVIVAWEDVWHALGQPGELGETKAVAALRTVLANASTPTDGDP